MIDQNIAGKDRPCEYYTQTIKINAGGKKSYSERLLDLSTDLISEGFDVDLDMDAQVLMAEKMRPFDLP